MKLRKLEPKDAPWMLEWMHNEDAVAHLQGNFLKKTLQDCLEFITRSQETDKDLNLAIVGEDDTYLGTVSLKHIDRQSSDAEFAIAIRSCAMGTGCARFAMDRILTIGLQELGLARVFWCVSPENKRAVRFYEKGGYARVDAACVDAQRYYTPQRMNQLRWYCVGSD